MNTTQKTHAIEQSVTISASPERIFKALTDANELEKWFPTKVESNPVKGGKYKFVFGFSGDATERNHDREGVFTDLIQGKKVEYNWMDRTTVTFNLESKGNETEVKLNHNGWFKGQDDQNIEAHTGGWSFFLSNLKSYLENGTDNRSQMLSMKTNK